MNNKGIIKRENMFLKELNKIKSNSAYIYNLLYKDKSLFKEFINYIENFLIKAQKENYSHEKKQIEFEKIYSNIELRKNIDKLLNKKNEYNKYNNFISDFINHLHPRYKNEYNKWLDKYNIKLNEFFLYDFSFEFKFSIFVRWFFVELFTKYFNNNEKLFEYYKLVKNDQNLNNFLNKIKNNKYFEKFDKKNNIILLSTFITNLINNFIETNEIYLKNRAFFVFLKNSIVYSDKKIHNKVNFVSKEYSFLTWFENITKTKITENKKKDFLSIFEKLYNLNISEIESLHKQILKCKKIGLNYKLFKEDLINIKKNLNEELDDFNKSELVFNYFTKEPSHFFLENNSQDLKSNYFLRKKNIVINKRLKKLIIILSDRRSKFFKNLNIFKTCISKYNKNLIEFSKQIRTPIYSYYNLLLKLNLIDINISYITFSKTYKTYFKFIFDKYNETEENFSPNVFCLYTRYHNWFSHIYLKDIKTLLSNLFINILEKIINLNIIKYDTLNSSRHSKFIELIDNNKYYKSIEFINKLTTKLTFPMLNKPNNWLLKNNITFDTLTSEEKSYFDQKFLFKIEKTWENLSIDGKKQIKKTIGYQNWLIEQKNEYLLDFLNNYSIENTALFGGYYLNRFRNIFPFIKKNKKGLNSFSFDTSTDIIDTINILQNKSYNINIDNLNIFLFPTKKLHLCNTLISKSFGHLNSNTNYLNDKYSFILKLIEKQFYSINLDNVFYIELDKINKLYDSLFYDYKNKFYNIDNLFYYLSNMENFLQLLKKRGSFIYYLNSFRNNNMFKQILSNFIRYLIDYKDKFIYFIENSNLFINEIKNIDITEINELNIFFNIYLQENTIFLTESELYILKYIYIYFIYVNDIKKAIFDFSYITIFKDLKINKNLFSFYQFSIFCDNYLKLKEIYLNINKSKIIIEIHNLFLNVACLFEKYHNLLFFGQNLDYRGRQYPFWLLSPITGIYKYLLNSEEKYNYSIKNEYNKLDVIAISFLKISIINKLFSLNPKNNKIYFDTNKKIIEYFNNTLKPIIKTYFLFLIDKLKNFNLCNKLTLFSLFKNESIINFIKNYWITPDKLIEKISNHTTYFENQNSNELNNLNNFLSLTFIDFLDFIKYNLVNLDLIKSNILIFNNDLLGFSISILEYFYIFINPSLRINNLEDKNIFNNFLNENIYFNNNYYSGYLIEYDQSSSVCQIAGFLAGDITVLNYTNVLSKDIKNDIYFHYKISFLYNLNELTYLNFCNLNKKSLKNISENNFLFIRNILIKIFYIFDRKFFKSILMPYFYGMGIKSIENLFRFKLDNFDVNFENLDFKLISDFFNRYNNDIFFKSLVLLYLSNIAIYTIEKNYSQLIEFFKDLTELARRCTEAKLPLSFNLLENNNISYSNLETVRITRQIKSDISKKIKTSKYYTTTSDISTSQITGFCANYIQSIDGSLARLYISNFYHRYGICIEPLHDSFRVHPTQLINLQKIIKEVIFKELWINNVLEKTIICEVLKTDYKKKLLELDKLDKNINNKNRLTFRELIHKIESYYDKKIESIPDLEQKIKESDFMFTVE